MQDVEEIKSRLNVEEIVGEYVKLTPAGTNTRGLCPFHREKTPSFMVSAEKQIWHCFGCGKGGDMLSFLMEIEGIEFPEALRILAERAGVDLKQSQVPAYQKDHKSKVFDVLSLLASWYHQSFLHSQKGEAAREYSEKRGLSSETLKAWQVGYAPDLWDEGLKFARKKNFKDAELKDAGLFISKDSGGMYDRFRHRLMFPIHDHRGMVVGFGGRMLENSETDKGDAKYINSPQTITYDKSRVLYGLYHAKQAIRESKEVVVVEGYMDVISSVQAGVINIVAASGTALTPQHAKLLKRYATHLCFAFDNDEAGLRAAQRGLEVAWNEGFYVKAISLPEGKDPDDLAREDPAAWKKAVETAAPVIDYWIDVLGEKIDTSAAEGKRELAKYILPLIKRVPDPIERSYYIQKLSTILKVPEEALKEALSKIREKKVVQQESPSDQKKEVERIHVHPEEHLMALVVVNSELIPVVIDIIKEDVLPTSQLKELYNQLKTYYNNGSSGKEDLFEFLSMHENSVHAYASVLSLLADDVFGHLDKERQLKEFQKILHRIQRAWFHGRKKEIVFEIKFAEEQGDTDLAQKLINEQQEINNNLQRLER